MNNVKLIIFDLDGVLIDSREMHYKTLNDALRDYGMPTIGWDEHLTKYDGLPTTQKLQLLNKTKNVPSNLFDAIWKKKQEYTIREMANLPPDFELGGLFIKLRQQGYHIAVASNSIRKTIGVALNSLCILPYVDFIQSNEDVKRGKPYPEMYWNCMKAFGVLPHETVIVEDSHIGRQGAIDSGARLFAVENRNSWNSTMLFDFIESNSKKQSLIPWRDSKLNVVIPMAGAGSRFAVAGYTFPKPLIEVRGKPMIKVVVDNLNVEAQFIFIVQREHFEKYHLSSMLKLIAQNCKIVVINGMTDGAARTVLEASQYINNDNPLLIANSDQFVEWDSNNTLYAFNAGGVDAGIVTFNATHPKWSYVSLDENGWVNKVAEKEVISDLATVGIYYWKHGRDFVDSAHSMINKNIRVNNEFYVAPVFNEAIQKGLKIRTKNADKMWGIGDPESLEIFLKNGPEV